MSNHCPHEPFLHTDMSQYTISPEQRTMYTALITVHLARTVLHFITLVLSIVCIFIHQ